jgi:hypothetical protein
MAPEVSIPKGKPSSTSRLILLTVTLTLFTALLLWRLLNMAPLSHLALVLGGFQLANAASTLAPQEVDFKWYAPKQRDLNNLTKVLTADGVYGFIYDTSRTPDRKYGTYNWCNMPHVRKREYVKASKDYELQYVEVVRFTFP